MKIVPAPLEPTLQAFSDQISRLLPYFKRFSLDIQDGKAVPTATLSINEISTYLSLNKEIFQDVIFDFDLMIEQYEPALDQIKELSQRVQIGNIVILKSVLGSSSIPMRDNLSIGLSLNPQDTIEDLTKQYNLNLLPAIQIMTIHAGPQGQSFIEDMLNKIDQLREVGYRSSIYIDGAVNKETLPHILSRENLPDFACVGSFLTRSESELEERVNYLKSIES